MASKQFVDDIHLSIALTSNQFIDDMDASITLTSKQFIDDVDASSWSSPFACMNSGVEPNCFGFWIVTSDFQSS